jgi:hypothetical protein
VLDADIVSRLSIESFEDLRDSVLEMICRIKIPKYKVLTYSRKGSNEREALTRDNASALHEKDEMKESTFKQQVVQFYEFQAGLKEKNKSKYIKLCPPGRIIQLFQTQEGKSTLRLLSQGKSEQSSGRANQYTARWAERRDLQKVLISPHLLADHDPINVKNKLQDLALNFGLTPPYSNVLAQCLDDAA